MAGAFCGNIDLSKIDKGDFVSDGQFAWVKAEVLEKIYKINDKFYTVIIFSNGCFVTQCQGDQKIGDALLWFAANILAADGDGPFNEITLPSGVAANICGTPDIGKFTKALSAIDVNAVNQYGFQPAAMEPLVAAIPLRSNIKIYGPYASSNFGLCGGATVESDPDLCPWVFGSANAMNMAGQAKANSMNTTPLAEAETGTITVPEMPTSNIGSQLASGPNLTGINVSFGSSGITSTYSYQTYTPKPGGFTRLFIDRLKSAAKYRQQQIKFLRNNKIDLNKINRRLQTIRAFNQQNNDLARMRANQATAQRVLVGEIYDHHPDTSGQRTVVAATTLPKVIQEMRYDFEKKAYISLDGLYGPVSVNGDGDLPRYASYSGEDGQPPCHKASPTLPYAPFATGNNLSVDGMNMSNYNLEIYQRGLNPVTNPGGNPNSSDNDGDNSGHVIDMLGRSSGSLEDGFIMNFYLGDDAGKQYEEDYRFLGMRGPLLLHSWGYDTQGKPIPNEADDEAQAKVGSFKALNNKDKFLKDWLQKPSTWPVAPVDLRFDRDRGVWVSPPSYKIVVAKLEEDLDAYGKAKASIVTKNTEKEQSYGRPLINADGEEVKSGDDESDAKIVVVDRIGQSFTKNSLVYVYYDTHTCEYIILVNKQTTIRFKLIDSYTSYCDNRFTGNTDIYAQNDPWVEYAGYGDKFPNAHSVGIRIDCDGNPVDNQNQPIVANDITLAINDPNSDLAKRIFVNLYDTAGRFGPSYNYYAGSDDFQNWKDNAATGFATIVTPRTSGLSCSMGDDSQCLNINSSYDSYDIIFLESYARFIECVLDQDLYPSQSKLTDYSNDWYKTTHPSGNAAATIYDNKFYGDSPNGKEPKFFKIDETTTNTEQGIDIIEPVSLRVFDPFIDDDIHKNPFRLLKEGDRVLCVFNDKLKKYTIYNSLDDGTRVVKFALVSDKLVTDTTAQAILINRDNKPITKDTKDLITDQDMFDDNIITVVDSYSPGNPLSAFGPALGSDEYDHHLNGFNLNIQCYNQILFPFKGFALRRGSPTNEDGDITVSYEIISLEHYAKTIHGKAASIGKDTVFNGKNYYLGLYNQYEDGVQPIARGTSTLGIPNVYLEYTNTNFNGDHSYFVGRIADGVQGSTSCENAVDGCSFTATLNPVLSTSSFLVYTVVECEFLAIKGQTKIKTFAKGDDLNGGETVDSSNNNGIESVYRQGFIWDKVKSKSIYDKIAIKNRENWTDKAKIIPSGILETSLISIDNDGTPTYKIIFADTIAQVGEKYLTTEPSPGLFGHPSYAVDDRVAKDTDKFYEGMDPINLANNKPKFTLTNDQQWMTYQGAKIAGIWDETPGASVPNDGSYRIIYAQEAPIVITGTAIQEFTPNDLNNIQVYAMFPTCAGADKAPIPLLLTTVANPMGHGAKIGDYVTVQREFTGAAQDGANYKYIVIGTGHPPGALKN